MAKCILDLTNVGSYGNIGDVYTNAETFLINSKASLDYFFDLVTRPGPYVTYVGEIIVRDAELYPNLPNNEEIVSIDTWRDSLKSETGNTLKVIRTDTGKTVIDTLMSPSGETQDSDGRVNLKSLGGEECTRGYYGIIADELIEYIPVYEMCYVPRSTITGANLAMAVRVDTIQVKRLTNRRGPVIISDEIAQNSGKDKSIVSDLTNPDCLPKPPDPPKVSSFYANDQSWGIVPLETKQTKSLLVENRGETRLVVIDFNPKSDKYFTLLNVISSFELQPGESKSFEVEYTPLDEAETNHKMVIKFDVYEDGDLTKPISGEKLVSVLTGTGDLRDLIDDVIDDFGDGVLTDDDNGTYVTKTLSRIIHKSSPTVEWRTKPLWKCVGERLYTFFTGSSGAVNDKFYLPIYNKITTAAESHHQFDISYGHRLGSGSYLVLDGGISRPSQVMYKKYLLECYEPNPTSSKARPTRFEFKNGVNGDSVYFIQMDRDDFKDMLDPGNFELCLSPLSSSSNQLINTGSNCTLDQSSTTIYTLIDESWDAKQNATDEKSLREWYYVTSGSKRDGVYGEESDNAWGVVFPRIGLIVLDGNVLDQSCSFNTVTASINGDNIYKLFLSISGSSSTTVSRSFSGSFFARSAEKVVKETYFCRVGQNEFNYSNNPTYVSGSENDFKYTYFDRNPHSYITTIGLYNKKGSLVAVGKVKNPILKNSSKSYVFEVKVRLN